MNKTVLVTGANGQLGKTIHELYSKNELGLDFIFLSKVDLDITQKDQLKNLFNENSFDFCINCAAYTNVEQAEKTPEITFKVNAEGVKNIAEVCKESSTILIHISTDYVFDGEKSEPYTINDIPNPINEYGKSKLQGEKYIQKILDKYFIIRTSWLYSKKYGKNFYRSILEKAKIEKELLVTIEQVGCPTNVINLSKYIISLIIDKNSYYGLHHFSDQKSMTWYDFAKIILKENKIKINIKKVNHFNNLAKRPKNSVL